METIDYRYSSKLKKDNEPYQVVNVNDLEYYTIPVNKGGDILLVPKMNCEVVIDVEYIQISLPGEVRINVRARFIDEELIYAKRKYIGLKFERRENIIGDVKWINHTYPHPVKQKHLVLLEEWYDKNRGSIFSEFFDCIDKLRSNLKYNLGSRDINIKDLDISTRTYNTLIKNIGKDDVYISDLVKIYNENPDKQHNPFLRYRNFGHHSLNEIMPILKKYL